MPALDSARIAAAAILIATLATLLFPIAPGERHTHPAPPGPATLYQIVDRKEEIDAPRGTYRMMCF